LGEQGAQKTNKKDKWQRSSIIFCWLVVSTPLKNMKISWDDYPIYYGKNKECLKPPTSIYSKINSTPRMAADISILMLLNKLQKTPLWPKLVPFSSRYKSQTLGNRMST